MSKFVLENLEVEAGSDAPGLENALQAHRCAAKAQALARLATLMAALFLASLMAVTVILL